MLRAYGRVGILLSRRREDPVQRQRSGAYLGRAYPPALAHIDRLLLERAKLVVELDSRKRRLRVLNGQIKLAMPSVRLFYPKWRSPLARKLMPGYRKARRGHPRRPAAVRGPSLQALRRVRRKTAAG